MANIGLQVQVPVSVIILTKNEEQDLPMCLNALSWTDDIHLLDSGSEDRTIEIAKSYGLKISYNPFESFGKQRNFALDNIDVKYDWILFLDADEVCTPEFVTALQKAITEAPPETAGYYCCWKMMLEGTWLKRCDSFPKWQFRLLRKGRANFTDFGHGQKEGEVQGKLEYLREPYLHYSYSKGWAQWIARHNKYSSDEARDRLGKKPPFKNIFSKNTSVRNPALKSWVTGLPGWPLLRFTYSYIFKLGFLEGAPGFIICANMAYYEFLIQIKIRELKKGKG